MIRIEEQTAAGSAPRRLSDFDPAALLKPGKSSKSGKPRKAGK
jgi:hypothetical protein